MRRAAWSRAFKPSRLAWCASPLQSFWVKLFGTDRYILPCASPTDAVLARAFESSDRPHRRRLRFGVACRKSSRLDFATAHGGRGRYGPIRESEISQTHGNADPSKLCNHSLLELASRDVNLSWRLESKGQQQEIVVESRLICSDVSILREAAERGLGIARLPTFEVEGENKLAELVRVLPRWRSRSVPVTLLFPSHKSLAPNVRAFMDAIVGELKLPAFDP